MLSIEQTGSGMLRGIPHVAEAHAVDNGDNGDWLRATSDQSRLRCGTKESESFPKGTSGRQQSVKPPLERPWSGEEDLDPTICEEITEFCPEKWDWHCIPYRTCGTCGQIPTSDGGISKTTPVHRHSLLETFGFRTFCISPQVPENYLAVLCVFLIVLFSMILGLLWMSLSNITLLGGLKPCFWNNRLGGVSMANTHTHTHGSSFSAKKLVDSY